MVNFLPNKKRTESNNQYFRLEMQGAVKVWIIKNIEKSS